MVVDANLIDKIGQLPTQPFEGKVFRMTFGNVPPDRENIRGARWNPPDIPAIYACLERETVIAEGEHILAAQPIPPQLRKTVHTIKISLNKLLDLRSADLLADLGVSQEALQSDDFWACQRIGEAVNRLGYDGILVPSVRHRGANLVIFRDNGGDDIETIESEELA